MAERILLVEDDPTIVESLGELLRSEGYAVDHAATQDGALEAALGTGDAHAGTPVPYALVLLDVTLAQGNGFAVCTALKQARPNLPVIFLTASSDEFTTVAGIQMGADDYIAKPFLPQELMLRIAAVLRRCYAEESPLLELDACRVNFATAEVLRADGGTAQLTAKEHEILSVLARNAGRIVTIDALCEACWGTSFGYDNSLMAHIRRLREKIEADPSKPVSLVTARGLGYKLVTRP